MKIPFVSLEEQNNIIKPQLLRAVEEVIDSKWYILGEKVKLFEENYSQYNQVAYTIGVANGLDALHLALKALNVGEGDEVIVPSNTYIATWLAVSYSGATIVPVEPDINTYNIRASEIEKVISSKTKAIIPVHLYGQACEMAEICELATRENLFIIEDNAQAQGASYNGKLTGTFGNLNATSFYPGKNLGAMGDAGAITTNNTTLAKKVKILRNYGSIKKYKHDFIGYNSRLDEIQAAILDVKLKLLPEWTKERQAIASQYDEYLKGVGDIILPQVAANASHVYHLYVIRTTYRDQLQNYLAKKGIETLIHYPVPPHFQNAYNQLNYTTGSYLIAEEIASTCLSLPLWIGLTTLNVERVCEMIKEFYGDK